MSGLSTGRLDAARHRRDREALAAASVGSRLTAQATGISRCLKESSDGSQRQFPFRMRPHSSVSGQRLVPYWFPFSADLILPALGRWTSPPAPTETYGSPTTT